MTEVERIVRIFHESWDLRDPERGAAVIAEDCRFEDVARGEVMIGATGYIADYHRWRTAFPDGQLEVVNVILDGDWAVVEFRNWAPRPVRCNRAWGPFLRAAVRWKRAIAA